MDTNDRKSIEDVDTNTLIDLYKEVDSFISFLHDEHKKNVKEI